MIYEKIYQDLKQNFIEKTKTTEQWFFGFSYTSTQIQIFAKKHAIIISYPTSDAIFEYLHALVDDLEFVKYVEVSVPDSFSYQFGRRAAKVVLKPLKEFSLKLAIEKTPIIVIDKSIYIDKNLAFMAKLAA